MSSGPHFSYTVTDVLGSETAESFVLPGAVPNNVPPVPGTMSSSHQVLQLNYGFMNSVLKSLLNSKNTPNYSHEGLVQSVFNLALNQAVKSNLTVYF